MWKARFSEPATKMLVDLVEVTTGDGVRLHGALELPAAAESAAALPETSPVDAWLCIHGTGSNFYSAATLAALAPKLLAGGAAVLRANTRGHDIICTGPSAFRRSMLGAALERIDSSPLDLVAWIDFLQVQHLSRLLRRRAVTRFLRRDQPPGSHHQAGPRPHTQASWQAVRRSPEIRALFQRLVRQDPKRRKIDCRGPLSAAHHAGNIENRPGLPAPGQLTQRGG